jgi:hypothetical protein
MNTRDRALALGIDPDDPRYDERHNRDGQVCDWCHRHDTARPRLICDVQRAEGEALAAEGKPHEPCSICREPRNQTRGTLCPECQARSAYAAKQERRRKARSRSMYLDDGLGCVERLHPTEAALLARDGRLGE